MKYFFFLFIISFASYGKEKCFHDAHNFRCVKYIRNYDADTITFNIPGVHPLLGKK